jgi:hypothetical protein
MPLGRQILAAAGVDVRCEHSLFAILPSGDFEDIRLDEPFDLRGRGVEQFVAFRTAAHCCCCGCGEEVVTPFTPTDWSMTLLET